MYVLNRLRVLAPLSQEQLVTGNEQPICKRTKILGNLSLSQIALLSLFFHISLMDITQSNTLDAAIDYKYVN